VDEHPFSFLGLASQAELLQEFSQRPVQRVAVEDEKLQVFFSHRPTKVITENTRCFDYFAIHGSIF
jgi:hypothetical protein